jgi:hypothetical protein
MSDDARRQIPRDPTGAQAAITAEALRRDGLSAHRSGPCSPGTEDSWRSQAVVAAFDAINALLDADLFLSDPALASKHAVLAAEPYIRALVGDETTDINYMNGCYMEEKEEAEAEVERLGHVAEGRETAENERDHAQEQLGAALNAEHEAAESIARLLEIEGHPAAAGYVRQLGKP